MNGIDDLDALIAARTELLRINVCNFVAGDLHLFLSVFLYG
jgi:hypothetical protein